MIPFVHDSSSFQNGVYVIDVLIRAFELDVLKRGLAEARFSDWVGARPTHWARWLSKTKRWQRGGCATGATTLASRSRAGERPYRSYCNQIGILLEFTRVMFDFYPNSARFNEDFGQLRNSSRSPKELAKFRENVVRIGMKFNSNSLL